MHLSCRSILEQFPLGDNKTIISRPQRLILKVHILFVLTSRKIYHFLLAKTKPFSRRPRNGELGQEKKGTRKVFKHKHGRVSPDHFQTARQMPALDWAQKPFVVLCPISEHYHWVIVVRMFVQDSCCFAIFARFVHQGCSWKHTFVSSFVIMMKDSLMNDLE